jgi:hypothetical protein
MREEVKQKGRCRKEFRDINPFLLGIIIVIMMMFFLKYLLIFLVTNSELVSTFLCSLKEEETGII